MKIKKVVNKFSIKAMKFKGKKLQQTVIKCSSRN